MAADGPVRAARIPDDGWDPRLRVFRAGDEVDTTALVTARYVVVVDTMSTPALAADILELVRPDLAGRDLLVVNTHADYDHAWGNSVFAPDGAYPAPIIGHELTRARLTGEESRADLVARAKRDPRFAGIRLVPPSITFTDGMRIHGGDLTLELVPTPGHTADHVAVWVPDIQLLLAGDAAESPFPCVHTVADLPALLASLRRMRALRPVRVVPCHGGTTDPGLLDRNLAYFARLDDLAGQLIASGALPPDWAARADLADLLGLPFDEAVRAAGQDPATVSDIYRTFHAMAARAAMGARLAGQGT
jgi:glyoxylase-like metal-dependent hydrolase (beta-lactamase superfamily II)